MIMIIIITATIIQYIEATYTQKNCNCVDCAVYTNEKANHILKSYVWMK